MSLRQDSLYRYRVPRQHVDGFIAEADNVLQETVAAWENRVESTLHQFLFRLEKELQATLEVSPEALFWMRDNLALLLATAGSEEDFADSEERLLQETIYLLDALE